MSFDLPRRSFLLTATATLSAFNQSASSQTLSSGPKPSEGLTYSGASFSNYWECFPDYLTALASRARKKREADLALLTTLADISARQKWVRDMLWKSIGGMPERTPLNERQTGLLERPSYYVRKYVYESQPNLFISANLYVPKGAADRRPAVIFQSGHAWEGKAYPSYQRFCQGLVQQGYVVLAFDPMGQGERIYYRNASGKSRLPSCDAEHTVPGQQLLLFGDTSTRFQLWDAIRSLDFLTSLPFVDTDRIGITGQSGGGTLTMLLAATDSRPAAAAVCMGNLENFVSRDFKAPGSVDDAEQDLLNCSLGFDRWDLLYPFAPRPLMVLPSERDFYATYSPDYIKNGWEEFGKLERVYSRLGAQGKLNWTGTPLPHGLAYDSRMAIYGWFAKWLKKESTGPATEPPVKPEEVSALWATEAGSTVVSLKSTTPFLMARARPSRSEPVNLKQLLDVTSPASLPKPAYRKIAVTQSGTVRVEAIEIQSDAEIRIPAWVIAQDKLKADEPIVLCLDPRGAEALWFYPEVDVILPSPAPIVCSADLRGTGALIPRFSPGPAEYAAWHQQEDAYAWASIVLGKPILGQRVTDILAVVRALQAHPLTAKRSIRIAALGKLTVPALFAAALEPAIQQLYLADGLVSFRQLVETEIYNHPFSNFVPGLLNHTDLPAVAGSLKSTKICIAGAVDAEGQPVKIEDVRAAYSSAAESGRLTILPKTPWSVETVLKPLI